MTTTYPPTITWHRNLLSGMQPYLLLSLLCMALFLPGIYSVPTLDRDEAHFAQASKQMLESGNFFQVRYQDTTRFRKPPGINWLQAGSVYVFDDVQNHAIGPYRLPSFLGALLAVLLTFAFAKQSIGQRAAFWGAALLASSLLLVYEAHLAVTDAMLLASVVLMQGALWKIYQNQSGMPIGYPLLFWLGMIIGIAVKGIAPLFAVLTIIALSIVDRDIRWLKQLRIVWGGLLLLLGSAWLLLVSQAEQANYLINMITTDLLPKLVSAHESHGGLPGYHLLLLPVMFWPASLFLWHAGRWGWQQRHSQAVKFLLAWIIPTWLFYELMPTKLPQYMLPVFPAIALLAGQAIAASRIDKPTVILKGLYVAWGILSIALITAVVWVAYVAADQVVWSAVLALGIVIIMVVVALSLVQKTMQVAATSVIVGGVIVFALIFQGVLPKLDRVWLTNRIAATIEQEAPGHINNEYPLTVIGYNEPSLVFELGTEHVLFADEAYVLAMQPESGQLILIEEKHLSNLVERSTDSDVQYRVLSQVSGFNYSKGQWLTLVLVTKHDA